MKTLFRAFFLLCASVCLAQTPVVISPSAFFSSYLNNGKPNAFGCVSTFASNTSTPIPSYTDNTGTVQNQNPVILSAGGTAPIWIQAGVSYSYVIKSSGGINCVAGSTVGTVNGIGAGASTLAVVVPYSSTPTFNLTAQNELFSITLTGDASLLPITTSGIIVPAYFTVQITQDAVGGHAFNWPANVVGGVQVGEAANQITTQQFIWNGFTATALGPGINGNSGNGPDATIGTLRTTYGIYDSGLLSVVGPLTVGGYSVPLVVGNVNTQVTQTGDTSLHTIYTVPIPALGPNDQLRITLMVRVNVDAGNPVVELNYGGSLISPAVTVNVPQTGQPNGLYVTIIGGNLGVTNSQSWDTLFKSLYVGSGDTNQSNSMHATSTVDSTTPQNLTVTFQGGANSDSITFYRMIVELI